MPGPARACALLPAALMAMLGAHADVRAAPEAAPHASYGAFASETLHVEFVNPHGAAHDLFWLGPEGLVLMGTLGADGGAQMVDTFHGDRFGWRKAVGDGGGGGGEAGSGQCRSEGSEGSAGDGELEGRDGQCLGGDPDGEGDTEDDLEGTVTARVGMVSHRLGEEPVIRDLGAGDAGGS